MNSFLFINYDDYKGKYLINQILVLKSKDTCFHKKKVKIFAIVIFLNNMISLSFIRVFQDHLLTLSKKQRSFINNNFRKKS